MLRLSRVCRSAAVMSIIAVVVVLHYDVCAAKATEKNAAKITLTVMACPQGLDDPPRAYLGGPPLGHLDYSGQEIPGPPKRLAPGFFQFAFLANQGAHLVTVASRYCSGREIFASLANHDLHI